MAVDGEVISSIELALDVEPKQTGEVKIQIPESCKLGAFVQCHLIDKDGEEVALWEEKLNVPVEALDLSNEGAKIKERDNSFVIKTFKRGLPIFEIIHDIPPFRIVNVYFPQ